MWLSWLGGREAGTAGASVGAPRQHGSITPPTHPPTHPSPTQPPSPRSNITRQHLADYIASNYTAPRMVISAAGAVDHAALVAAAEKAFAKLPSEGKTAAQLVKEVRRGLGVGWGGCLAAWR